MRLSDIKISNGHINHIEDERKGWRTLMIGLTSFKEESLCVEDQRDAQSNNLHHEIEYSI
jgi:hypothetical protein